MVFMHVDDFIITETVKFVGNFKAQISMALDISKEENDYIQFIGIDVKV